MLFKIFSIPDNHSAKFRITTIRSINLSIILACTLAILGSTFIYSHERSHLLPSMYLLLGGSISLVLISQWFAHADKLDIAARLDIIATQGLAAILLIFESKQFGFVVLALAMCSLIVAALVINPKERKWFAISWLILYPALLMFTNILDIYFGISIVETYNVASNFSADTLYTRSVVIITGWIVHIAMITVTYGSLQYLNNEFEQRLIQVKEAQEHSQKLKRLDIQKSEFMAEMSHELRTPLNGVIGFTRQLYKTPLNKHQKDYLDTIELSANSLLTIISDILDFSKLEAGAMELESMQFQLRDNINEVMTLLAPSAHEKQLELSIFIHPQVPDNLTGDPTRFKQILINLLSNAIKFTERGVVSIFIKPVDIAGNDVELELRVKDTGIGMTRDEQVKLFNAFSQTDGSITRKFGGTGLGLAISQHLVDLMQGQIQVASTKGQGSEFYFQIHLQLSNPLQLKNLFPKMAKEMHVALVCENPHLAENLADWLEMIGSHFRVYHDLNEYEHGVVDNCDLLLVDEQELMTGEVADVLRRQSQQGKVGIMKSVGNREKIPETLFEYVDWTLTKPITHRDLLRMYSGLATGTEVSEQIPGNLIHKQVLKGFRILAVEDNKVNQILIRKLLQKAGAEVELAENGQKALDVLKSQPQDYNLVLMDMQMPIMDGVTATIAIRSKLRLVNLPIIGLTANAMAGDRERCLNAGMNDYLTKPINQVQLFDTLSRWLQ